MDSLALQVKTVIETLESGLSDYSRVRIVTTTLIGAYIASAIYEAYQDGDFTWNNIKGRAFRYFIKLPIVRGIAAKEMGEADEKITDHCRAIYKGEKFVLTLPKKGLEKEQILEQFEHYLSLSKIKWREGRASGTVYSDLSPELAGIVKEVYGATSHMNPLHPEVFPGINKMEAEIVRMVANLYRGDDEVCGTLTSGGTESLLLSMKAYRDYARAERGITRPELVAPATAHAAFEKACHYFRIRFRPIPVDPVTFKVDLKAMKRAITSNTIALVGSACGYPHGIIDDIGAIAAMGKKYGVPVHVDCCLGGFIVPFVRAAGFSLPDVDFSVDGVTSISVDTHKYGYAPKGSSVILYKNKNIRKHQFSVQTNWPGGIYASPTISGSRPGSAIATCWASLMQYGFDGYVEATKKILEGQRKILDALKKEKDVYIMGEPILSVIGLGSNVFNIFRLSELLSKRGWALNPLQFPSGFHICVTLMHTQEGIIDALIKDMQECIAICAKEPSKPVEGQGIVYGMAQAIPDRAIVSDIACNFLNSIYETK